MKKISFRFMAAVIAFLLCFSCIPVNAADGPSIAFDETFAIVAVGESYQLKYHTENVTESDVIVWEVTENSKTIITIDQSGVITGLANGYANVNVSINDSFRTQTLVLVAPHIESIRWEKDEYTVPVGITYSNGEWMEPLIIVEPEEAFQRAQMNGIFEVSDSSLASADAYSITGMSEGTGTITVTADGKSASTRLTVTPEGHYAASIVSDWWSPRAIDCSTYIEPGDIVDIEAVLEPYYGQDDCSDEKVVWTVVDGDKDVIDVKFNGNIATVTGLKSGYGRLKAEITNGYYTYFPVRVAPKVESIQFDESMSYKLPYMKYENYDIFNYLIIEPKEAAYNRQYTIDTDNYSAVFTMGVPGIYSMEINGLGTSTITVTPTDNPDLAVSHVFEVVDPSEAGFPESMTVLTDTEITRYLHCRYPSYDSTGRGPLAVEYTPSDSLTATSWTSDNEDAVKVSENSLDRQGVASAIINCYSTGTANIKAVNKYNSGLEASFVVNVIDGMPEGLEYSTDINIKAADDEGYTENPESFTMQAGTDYEMIVKLAGSVIPDYSIAGKMVESLENIGNVSYMPDFMYSGYGYVSESSRITFTAVKAGTETLTIGDRSVELIVEGGSEPASVIAVSDTEQTICIDHVYSGILKIEYSGDDINEETEWTSSNEDIVIALGTGPTATLRAMGEGNAVVTATNKENPALSVSFNITVVNELPAEDAYSLSVKLYKDNRDYDLPDPLELTVGEECVIAVHAASSKGITPIKEAFFNPAYMSTQLLQVKDVIIATASSGPNGQVFLSFLVTVCADQSGEETFQIRRSDVHVKIDEQAHEHEYGAPVYTWSADNSTVTARIICKSCGDVISETVNSSYQLITEPTCTDKGLGRYTAVFANELFETQTKDVQIDALGHKYELTEWKWSKDYTAAQAVFTCQNDRSHTETVDADVTIDGDKATATVTFEGKTYTDVKEIPAAPQLTVTLNKTEAEMPTESTLQLAATVEPSDADNKKIIWTSSDEEIATVDQNGKVTALRYGKVTITATAEADSNAYATCEIQTRFYDVNDPKKYYYEPVYWAADNEITTGYDRVYFGPQKNCTRQELAIFLWRLAGKPAVSGELPFSDTKYKEESASFQAILWCSQQGIVRGYSDGTFKPKANVSRKDTLIMLYRLAGKPEVEGEIKFPDVVKMNLSKTSDTYKAILWGVNNGITNGYKDGNFQPKTKCQREHIVTFIYRADKVINN